MAMAMKLHLQHLLQQPHPQNKELMSDITTDATCGTCGYFRDGFCLRYPPQLVFSQNQINTQWPSVAPETWCGEFSPIMDPPIIRPPGQQAKPKK
jgi:hypothetical protein